MKWNIVFGLKSSAGTSKVIQRGQKERKINKRTRRKHPAKLVKAAACRLLSPHHNGNGLDIEGANPLDTPLVFQLAFS